MPCITELHSLFYSNGVKLVPHNIYDLLTPVALAHLIQGDGQAASDGLRLCTDSYSVKDIVRLMNVLIIRYRLECTLHIKSSKYFRIYIKKSSMSQLITIVKPHMHDSMLYKLGLNVSVTSSKKIKVSSLQTKYFSTLSFLC